MNINLRELSEKYRNELLLNVIPFWEKYSPDMESGGFYTCLDRFGKVYDTDKFIWLQAREVWMFASLFNNVEKNPEWLRMALHGAGFLQKYGRDEQGNWYFSLTREGKPLVQPYNIFSDCFATMAFAQLSKATGKEEFAQIAKNTFENILRKSDNPKGNYNKSVHGTRPLKGFSLPMILCNLSLEIEFLLSEDQINATIQNCIHEQG
jgi:N-acylglucosamine 2-epimerase